MSKTVLPAPLTDGRYWRRLLATCHPDKPDGDPELFLFLTGLREHVEECWSLSDRTHQDRTHQDRGGAARRDRIPFDPGVDFEERTRCILRWYRDAPDPYRRVMMLLVDCAAADHGRAYAQQYQGASYRQLAAIAHAAGMDFEERQEWYAVAESVGLTERHAGHILNKLKRGGRRAA